MNQLFKFSELYIPQFFKKRELMNLFSITASAFGSTVPSMTGFTFEECLAAFAHYTKTEVEEMINRGEDLQSIQDQLYQGAYEFGTTFRKRYRVSTTSEVMAVSRLLYRVLGIEFEGTNQGIITISKCLFSNIYSSSTCRVISSLDAGMIAGLSEGGKLFFWQRITEGSDACRACFFSKEQIQ